MQVRKSNKTRKGRPEVSRQKESTGHSNESSKEQPSSGATPPSHEVHEGKLIDKPARKAVSEMSKNDTDIFVFATA